MDHTTGTVPIDPTWVQGRYLWRWWHTRVLSITRGQQMVLWTIQRPLPTWSVLRYWNLSLPCIMVDWPVPTALPLTQLNSPSTPLSADWWIDSGYNFGQSNYKRKVVEKYLGNKIETLLNPISIIEEQRVAETTHLQLQAEEERVISDTPIITIPCITDLPTVLQTQNPTAKRALKEMKLLHCHVTRNNTLGIMPVPAITQDWDPITLIRLQCSTKALMQMQVMQPGRQRAVNVVTMQEQVSFCMVHMPRSIMQYARMQSNMRIMHALWGIL